MKAGRLDMEKEQLKGQILYCLREALAQRQKRVKQIRGVALAIELMRLKDDDVTMEQAVVFHGAEMHITLDEAEEALREAVAKAA